MIDEAAAAERWIFGYGSLVWRPAFPFVERHPAEIVGWARRFYQGSTDHRGIPAAPGRVVTLVPAPAERCVGVIYRVAAEDLPATLEALDVREQGGYARVTTEAWRRGADGSAAPRRCVTYLATADNPNYLGPAPIEAIAAEAARAVGPSGPNSEYVLRLAEALRALGAEDPHVFAVERVLRSLLAEEPA